MSHRIYEKFFGCIKKTSVPEKVIRKKLKELKDINAPVKFGKFTNTLLVFSISIKSNSLVKELVNAGANIPTLFSNDYHHLEELLTIISEDVKMPTSINTDYYCYEIIANKEYKDKCTEIINFLIINGMELSSKYLMKFMQVNKSISKAYFTNILHKKIVIKRMMSISELAQKIFQFLISKDNIYLLNLYLA